jgi:hypothetical protein
MALGRFDFLVTPPSMHLPGSAGAIGPDLLRDHDVELDFARGRINFFRPSACGRDAVYWTRRPARELNFALDADGHITAVGMLDGRPVDILVDTGAVTTTITLEDATQEFGIHAQSPDVERIDDGSGGDAGAVYTYRFARLDLEGIFVREPTVVIRPDQTGLRTPHLRPEVLWFRRLPCNPQFIVAGGHNASVVFVHSSLSLRSSGGDTGCSGRLRAQDARVRGDRNGLQRRDAVAGEFRRHTQAPAR